MVRSKNQAVLNLLPAIGSHCKGVGIEANCSLPLSIWVKTLSANTQSSGQLTTVSLMQVICNKAFEYKYSQTI